MFKYNLDILVISDFTANLKQLKLNYWDVFEIKLLLSFLLNLEHNYFRTAGARIAKLNA